MTRVVKDKTVFFNKSQAVSSAVKLGILAPS